ncbi:MAG: PEP-CTERM sorting domain-containing protein, partial [Planctomycetota bacterium]
SAAAFVAVAGLTTSASADVIVDFGSVGYVDGNQALNGIPGLNDSGNPVDGTSAVSNTVRPFSELSPFTPTAMGWTTVSGINNTLYGGYEMVGAGNRRLEFARIGNSGGDDLMRIAMQVDPMPNGLGNSLAAVMLVQKEDFLTGSDAGSQVALNSDSVITAEVGANNNGQDRRFRLVVKQDGQYYIGTAANTIFPNVNIGTLTVSPDPDTGNARAMFSDFVFETYDPFSGVFFGDADVGTGTPFTGTFDDIEALGIYVEASRPDNGPGNLRTAIRGFTADTLVVIPEPTSALGIAGGMMLLVSRRRR